MTIETVTVGGKQYNIAQASAVDQKRLMHLLAARLTYNVGKDVDVQLDETFLMGALMGASEADFDEIAKIVLYKAAANGSTSLIELADFQSHITDYYMLVAAGVRCNLLDFLIWLDEARKPSVQPEKAPGLNETRM